MAAILGLPDDVVEAACAEVAQGAVVQAVNYNSSGQLVIAGNSAAVGRAMEACKARGAKRTVLLPVSAPCHSSLLQPAAERLRDRLASVELRTPATAVYAFDVSLHQAPAAIRESLYHQLFSPIRWSGIVRAMIGSGVTDVVECGPGKVLAALVKRAEGGRNIKVYAVEDPASLDGALTGCRENASD